MKLQSRLPSVDPADITAEDFSVVVAEIKKLLRKLPSTRDLAEFSFKRQVTFHLVPWVGHMIPLCVCDVDFEKNEIWLNTTIVGDCINQLKENDSPPSDLLYVLALKLFPYVVEMLALLQLAEDLNNELGLPIPPVCQEVEAIKIDRSINAYRNLQEEYADEMDRTWTDLDVDNAEMSKQWSDDVNEKMAFIAHIAADLKIITDLSRLDYVRYLELTLYDLRTKEFLLDFILARVDSDQTSVEEKARISAILERDRPEYYRQNAHETETLIKGLGSENRFRQLVAYLHDRVSALHVDS